MHEIRAVSGDGAGDIVGQRFRHNTGLVSMVLQNRHPLPYRGEYDAARQTVFTRRVAPPPMPSIVVLPLLVHDRPLGTLVLGSRRRAAFNDAVRSTLEVLASHMAVSLSNARMLRRLEELATMDGLTGLLNKRAMLEVAEQKIAARQALRPPPQRAGRRHRSLQEGERHLRPRRRRRRHQGPRRHPAPRQAQHRRVARFGGEEFVIICEETDARGAMLLAERVREELDRTTFHPQGKVGPSGQSLAVSVTCSIGVATYPEAGASWEELFKAADDALYVSKRSGRNRSTAWSPSMKSGAAPVKPAAA